MRFRLMYATGIIAAGLIALAGNGRAQEKKPVATDNTKVNQRDRSKAEPTADQGKNNASDRELMQKIRKSLTDDKNLSTYAHNVKIVAQGGKVTLKGPVRSAEEKRAVEEKAAAVAGAGNVSNELTVKPARTKKTS